MKSRKQCLFVTLLALAMCVPVLATVKPVIDSATPNYATNQLTIVGSSFGTAPTVKIDAQTLTLVSHSDNHRCHTAQRHLRRQLSADRGLSWRNRII